MIDQKKVVLEKAKKALKLYQQSDQNVSAGYDILRYAKQGLYKTKD